MNNSTNTSFRNRGSQYWNFLQGELLPGKAIELEGLTPTLERIIRVLEWVRVEQYVMHADHFGRPMCERTAMARTYCVKAVLGMQCTAALRERLSIDSKLRRICGFSAWFQNQALPSKCRDLRILVPTMHRIGISIWVVITLSQILTP
jgi:hypothetical protein